MTNKNIIYKYAPFSLNTLKLLVKRELWLGYPYNLNDPFEGECILKYNGQLPNDNFLEKFYKNELSFSLLFIQERIKEIKKNANEFERDLSFYLKERLKSDGVSSFSLVPDDIKMWSYYADSHKGICLIFDKTQLFDSIKSHFKKIKISKIKYRSSLPIVNAKFEKGRMHLKQIRIAQLKPYQAS